MPIYEYRCHDCDRLFQKLQSVGSGTAEVACPDCDSRRVERQLSTFASCTAANSGSRVDAPPAGCGPAGGG